MLLGRPWIHTSGAAPSSPHQRVKYAVEGHVVTVKKKLCLSLNLLHSRILKPLKKLLRLPSSHSKFGMLILFLRVPLCPKMSEASKMVARFMLNSPYQKGKGLGKNLQRIFAPVELPSADERFGLGYEPKKGDKERIIQERREKRLAHLEGKGTPTPATSANNKVLRGGGGPSQTCNISSISAPVKERVQVCKKDCSSVRLSHVSNNSFGIFPVNDE